MWLIVSAKHDYCEPLALASTMEIADRLVISFQNVGAPLAERWEKPLKVFSSVSSWEEEYKEALIISAKAKLSNAELTALGLKR